MTAPKSNKVLEGHRLQASLLRHDLLSLYTLFTGMKGAMIDAALARAGAISEGNKAPRTDPIEQLYTDYFESEVTRLLVQSAATLRMMDDHAELDLGHARYRVGTLHRGKSSEPLMLREASNKIIHLDKLDFKYVDLDGPEEMRKASKGLRVSEEELILTGVHKGKLWQADLLIPFYVRHGVVAAQFYGNAKNAAACLDQALWNFSVVAAARGATPHPSI